jgi:hypothetical protein
MKHKITFLCVITGFAMEAQSISPSIISSAGSTQNASGITMNWTLGEPVVGLMTNQGLQISNGYHKQLNLEVLSTQETNIEASILMYPNPVTDYLIVHNKSDTKAQFVLYNELGQPVIEQSLQTDENKINLGNLSSGIYIINIITEKSSKTNSYKLIKK